MTTTDNVIVDSAWCSEHERYEDSEAHDLARLDEYERAQANRRDRENLVPFDRWAD